MIEISCALFHDSCNERKVDNTCDEFYIYAHEREIEEYIIARYIISRVSPTSAIYLNNANKRIRKYAFIAYRYAQKLFAPTKSRGL